MLEKGNDVPGGGARRDTAARISATVSSEQKRKLRRYCAENDKTISGLIREFIDGLPFS